MKTFYTVLCGLLLTIGLAIAAQGTGHPSFSSLDKNHDAKLSLKEAMADPTITPRAFAAADSNRNGYLSRKEFRTIVAMRGANQKSGGSYQSGSRAHGGAWKGSLGKSGAGQSS